jgi:uncharacterized protein YndB with AHSA1/START domain
VLDPILWRVHLKSPPYVVYDAIASSAGRAQFWAESAIETDGEIHFLFPNGLEARCRVVEASPPHRFRLRYLGGSLVTFEMIGDGQGGTDLTLTDEEVPAGDAIETLAGWVSVLMALKAAIDHGVDLRTHDPSRSWDQRYVDN